MRGLFCWEVYSERRRLPSTEAGNQGGLRDPAGNDRHPTCMPGAAALRVKLVFHKDSEKLLGGQVSGGVCIGELVNVIVALIQGGMTADEIAAYQMGTHPALTRSLIAYPPVKAAAMVLKKM